MSATVQYIQAVADTGYVIHAVLDRKVYPGHSMFRVRNLLWGPTLCRKVRGRNSMAYPTLFPVGISQQDETATPFTSELVDQPKEAYDGKAMHSVCSSCLTKIEKLENA